MTIHRTNSASAQTARINRVIKANGLPKVKVQSFDYFGGSSQVSSRDIEGLDMVRETLASEGFKVGEIQIFSHLPPCFYVEFKGN